MKVLKNVFIFLFVALLLSMAGMSLSAGWREAKRTARNKKLWCWATAAYMVADSCCDYYGYSMIIRDYDELLIDTSGVETANIGHWYDDSYTAYGMQRAVVMHFNSNYDVNIGGSPDQTRSALPYLAQNNGTVSTYGTPGVLLSSTNLTILRSQLSCTYTTGGALRTGDPSQGHYFVIMSYNSGTSKYLIHDAENGNEYWVTQSEAFVNGLSTFGRSLYIITWFDYLT